MLLLLLLFFLPNDIIHACLTNNYYVLNCYLSTFNYKNSIQGYLSRICCISSMASGAETRKGTSVENLTNLLFCCVSIFVVVVVVKKFPLRIPVKNLACTGNFTEKHSHKYHNVPGINHPKLHDKTEKLFQEILTQFYKALSKNCLHMWSSSAISFPKGNIRNGNYTIMKIWQFLLRNTTYSSI